MFKKKEFLPFIPGYPPFLLPLLPPHINPVLVPLLVSRVLVVFGMHVRASTWEAARSRKGALVQVVVTSPWQVETLMMAPFQLHVVEGGDSRCLAGEWLLLHLTPPLYSTGRRKEGER